MEDIKRKLEALGPKIDRILQIGGAPGLSLGVLHKGVVIHTAHFGHRNANDAVPSNDDTLHTFASLTKIMTAVAIAQLVHGGKLDWDVPIREYLPAFRVRKDEIGMKSTLRDLLSLRTGIAPANPYWGFQNNELLLEPSEITATATFIGTAKPFGQFVYSQWNYALVAEIVKHVIGIPIEDYITQNIFKPLNMTRSSFGRLQDSEANVAHTHCTHDDGTTSRKPDATAYILASGMAACGGARGSIQDYLLFAQALLRDYKVQTENDVDFTPDSVFPLARTVFSAHVGMGPPQRSGIEHVAYCLGLYRTTLPGFLSLASPNFYYILGKDKLPAYGKALAGLEVFHHSGTAMGNIGALFLVPSSQSAVVAFANSQPLMDPTDFVAQLALSVLLDESPLVDFVKTAKMARSVTFTNYEKLERSVAQGKTDTPPTKPLSAYQGDYYNGIHNLVLSIAVAGNGHGLNLTFQHGHTGFGLMPYDGDTFFFPVNREDEMCTKGMWGFMYKDWHLFHFEINTNGEVESVSWRHDPYVASPEVFTKTPSVQVYARL
ncbi:beta-lactamase/transpeptidase-like protein [Periconia macrospinosa]|uniref:Beta-lactamase/transpeptidase-like protein n=1 Tax=Periconia macrospinosa TaxID=97972 RepID=A0A2V1DPP5_9PLEO|nr:beta-lactamase/transpeptidase-like protein [Periconia macrospinosa]